MKSEDFDKLAKGMKILFYNSEATISQVCSDRYVMFEEYWLPDNYSFDYYKERMRFLPQPNSIIFIENIRGDI